MVSNLPTDAVERHVYVVDDDVEVRQSLHFLLATPNTIVRSFASGHEFYEKISDLAAAPIILDIRMPQMTGLEFLGELAERNIDWPVIVISGHGEIDVAVQAIKLGAIDFLEKPFEASALEKCLDHAFLEIESHQASRHIKAASVQILSLLTPRESEVLAALCRGKANKQVAFSLSISPRTVEMHRANALRRLGVRSIAEVVTMIGNSKFG